jgi:hypothetical protein
MKQLNLFNTELLKYTVGIDKNNNSYWYVLNSKKDKDITIQKYLKQFPNTKTEQNNYKFFQYK